MAHVADDQIDSLDTETDRLDRSAFCWQIVTVSKREVWLTHPARSRQSERLLRIRQCQTQFVHVPRPGDICHHDKGAIVPSEARTHLQCEFEGET